MKNGNNKFFAAALPVMIGVTILNVFAYVIFAFSMYMFKFDPQYISAILTVAFFCFFLPTILWFTRIFSVVEFNEEGVRRSNFKFLCKRKIRWDEVAEIRFYRFPVWIIISKRPLGYKDFSFVVVRRDVIPIMYSKKVEETIRKFTDIIINGIDDVENN